MKTGWRTTEFWVTALLVTSVLLGWVGGQLDGDAAVIAAAVASGLYAASRGLAKKGTAEGDVRNEVLRALAAMAMRNTGGGAAGADGLHHGPPGGQHSAPSLN